MSPEEYLSLVNKKYSYIERGSERVVEHFSKHSFKDSIVLSPDNAKKVKKNLAVKITKAVGKLYNEFNTRFSRKREQK